MILSVEDLLLEEGRAGRHHSSGRFTLKEEVSEETLRRWRLPVATMYPLKLVQCAVRGGASAITIDINPFRTRIEWDGKPLGQRKLRDLFSQLTTPGRYGYLARALTTAVALPTRRIEVQSWTGASGFCQSWRRGESRCLPVADSKQRNCFMLHRALGEVARAYLRSGSQRLSHALKSESFRAFPPLRGRGCSPLKMDLKSNTQEQVHLWERCAYCPIPVWLNGRLVNRWPMGGPPGHPAHHLVERYLTGGSLQAPPATRATIAPRLKKPPRPGDFVPCRAVVGLTQGSSLARLEFVVDGVSMDTKEVDLAIPGLVAVIDGNYLATDLSGMQVAEDESYHELLQELRAHGEAMRRHGSAANA